MVCVAGLGRCVYGGGGGRYAARSVIHDSCANSLPYTYFRCKQIRKCENETSCFIGGRSNLAA